MRGKVAKKLRKIAQKATIGKPIGTTEKVYQGLKEVHKAMPRNLKHKITV